LSEHCIIRADFSSFRPVHGRKVLQIVLEVPIELGDDALKKLGGLPRPGESRWCAIALLEEKTEAQAPAGGGSPKKWSEYARSQQAAILCADQTFWAYFGCQDEADAVQGVRRHFRIKSRRELDTDEDAGKRWDEFVALYHLHREKHR
jgi:hypothetical protein